MCNKKNRARNAILVTPTLAKQWYELKQSGITGQDIASKCSFNTATVNRHIKAYGANIPISEPCKIHPSLAFFPSVIA